jgi:hypothetical protein
LFSIAPLQIIDSYSSVRGNASRKNCNTNFLAEIPMQIRKQTYILKSGTTTMLNKSRSYSRPNTWHNPKDELD